VTTDRTYRVWRCTSCGAAFTVPRPTQPDLDAFYDGSYFEGETGFGYVDYQGLSLAAVNARRDWTQVSRALPVDPARPRTVLDVGCATGDLLLAARDDGWSGVGVELSVWASQRARAQGLTVVESLASVPPTDDGFGLVTMFHVVEHLIDPRPTLRAVAGLVHPCGVVVIEVPQWRSLGRLLRRSSWAQLRPPEHITFLDPASMTALLRSTGLTPVQMTTPYPHLRDRWAVATGPRRVTAGLGLLGAVTAERLQRGGYLRVLARRG
jgi:SAM-dependent methyltransferase